MAKHEKTDNRSKNNRNFRIPEDAKHLAKMNFKKFKKDSGDYYDSKKDLKKAYYATIVEMLPDSISLICKYGHLPEVQETKTQIYEKLTDEKFVKYLTKEIKNELNFPNMMLLPIIINDIMVIASKQNAAESDESTVENYDLTDLVNLSHLILKKKIKKAEKLGLQEDLAFDLLSIIPDTEILKKSSAYHIRQLFGCLYEHAKTKDINFENVIKAIFGKDSDEKYIGSVITFALLERKEKITNFNETQQKLFNDITGWAFTTMEEMKKDNIYTILTTYADIRKKDDARGTDANRRYYITSLPESDYPKIIKVLERILNNDETLKKYF